MALALVVLFALPVAGIALGYADRAAVQAAADAAAVACAGQADVAQLVDARGHLYGVVVAVRAQAGPAAAQAMWRRDLALAPGVRAGTLRATVSGDRCAVQGTAHAVLPLLGILAPGRGTVTWVALAEARAEAPGTG